MLGHDMMSETTAGAEAEAGSLPPVDTRAPTAQHAMSCLSQPRSQSPHCGRGSARCRCRRGQRHRLLLFVLLLAGGASFTPLPPLALSAPVLPPFPLPLARSQPHPHPHPHLHPQRHHLPHPHPQPLPQAQPLPRPEAEALDKHCSGPPLWTPDGPQPFNGSWASQGLDSAFQEGPCLQVSGLGVAQTALKTLLVIDRSDLRNSYMRFPNGNYASAEEVDLASGAQRPLDLITNAFCSTGAHVSAGGGSFLSIGGSRSPTGVERGGASVRSFVPCADATCQFTLAGHMASLRWYPTSQLLGDGRVLMVGGSLYAVSLNSPRSNNPTVEYFPQGADQETFPLDFLQRTLPYNLYPFVHLLPSGRVFLFASDRYILFDTSANKQMGDEVPLPAAGATGPAVMRTYPLSGTSFLFPLRPVKFAQVMICGGSSTRAFPPGADVGNTEAAADDTCYRIKPEAGGGKPQWKLETMKVPRVMPCSVLLPDRHALIINGAQSGYAGIPNAAQRAVLTPEMYNTGTLKWHPGTLATSKVPRGYHSNALLLHDGTVFVSGSNPFNGIVQNATEFSTTFRTEFFLPPYLLQGVLPTLVKAPAAIKLLESFQVTFLNPTAPTALLVVLAHPGFSTHGANHGMRNVELKITSTTESGKGTYTALAVAPASYNVAPPTWYWLFVVADGRPNQEGHKVMVV